jgi:hypothetical protein
MRGAIPPLPQYVFMGWCLLKQRGNFTFTTTLHLSTPLAQTRGHSKITGLYFVVEVDVWLQFLRYQL